MESLKDKTAKGLLWGGMNNFIQQFLGMAFGIILGRLLSPHDYGMVAEISIFALLGGALQDSGFKSALANQKEVSDNDYNSVFWFNIIVGVCIYTILFFCAPLIASYYHDEALIPLCRYVFLGFVISGLGTAQSAYLFRNLKVKQQAKSSIVATWVSCLVGVGMAWAGCGYWSLATQGLVFIATYTLLLWHYSPWRPSLHIDFAPVKRMFPFSIKLLLTTMLTHVNNNIMNILLGRFFSSKAVGNYNQAFQWNSKAIYTIQGMMNQVAQPVFTETSNDSRRQLHILRKMIRFTAFISFPLLFGFALVSREFIIITITEKWLISAYYLRILCICGGFLPIVILLSNLIISKGRSDIYLWCTVALAALQLSTMLLIHGYGIEKMIIAYVVLNIVWVFVWHHFTGNLSGYKLLMFIKDIMPFCITAATIMTATYFATATITNLWLLLFSRIIIAALLYYFVMRLARVKILDDCITFAKSCFNNIHK